MNWLQPCSLASFPALLLPPSAMFASLSLFIGFLGLSGSEGLLLLTLRATVLSLQIFMGLASSTHRGLSLGVPSSDAFSTPLPTVPPRPLPPSLSHFFKPREMLLRVYISSPETSQERICWLFLTHLAQCLALSGT